MKRPIIPSVSRPGSGSWRGVFSLAMIASVHPMTARPKPRPISETIPAKTQRVAGPIGAKPAGRGWPRYGSKGCC